MTGIAPAGWAHNKVGREDTGLRIDLKTDAFCGWSPIVAGGRRWTTIMVFRIAPGTAYWPAGTMSSGLFQVANRLGSIGHSAILFGLYVIGNGTPTTPKLTASSNRY